MVFDAVHGAANFAALGVAHAADQAVARRDLEFVGIEKVDGLQSDLGSVGAEFVERNLLITPAGNGLTDIAFAFDLSCPLWPGD